MNWLRRWYHTWQFKRIARKAWREGRVVVISSDSPAQVTGFSFPRKADQEGRLGSADVHLSDFGTRHGENN